MAQDTEGRDIELCYFRDVDKGEVDQTTKLQKEYGSLMENVERLEQEYNKLRKASKFIMSVVERIDTERQIYSGFLIISMSWLFSVNSFHT